MNIESKNKVVCVLGMHRSGTSLLTRVLNICGLPLGDEEDLFNSRNNFNAKGHWENIAIIKINSELINVFGGSWDNPPDFPDKWEDDPRIDHLYRKASALVQSMNGKYGIWGFKEPRTSLLIPFWKKIIPDMIYVIPIRHPLEIANSLKNRDSFQFSKGLYLTKLYIESVFKFTRNEKYHFVNIRNLFSDEWQRELGLILKFINIEDTIEENKDDIQKFINPNMMSSISYNHQGLSDIIDDLKSIDVLRHEHGISAFFSLLCDDIYHESAKEISYYKNTSIRLKDIILRTKKTWLIKRIRKYLYL